MEPPCRTTPQPNSRFENNHCILLTARGQKTNFEFDAVHENLNWNFRVAALGDWFHNVPRWLTASGGGLSILRECTPAGGTG